MPPRKSSTKSKKSIGSSKKPVTVDDFIAQGSLALSKFQPELASKFFQRAHSMDPDNTNIMDALADSLIQIGETCEATDLLMRSTALAPLENPYKWMFLAQLQQGHDALQSYNRGIEILTEKLQTSAEADQQRALAKEISKAHCSVAELFLTDLCYDDGAEGSCEAAVMKALTIYPSGLDGMQALASLRLSQNRPADAAEIMKQVCGFVMRMKEVERSRTVVDEITERDVPEELEDLPENEFLVATAKLLIECGNVNKELNENACELILELLDDDDENIELWYMMGVASMSCVTPDVENAKYHLEKAKEMMDVLKETMPQEEFPYSEQYRLINEHLALLEQMGSLGESNDSNNQNVSHEPTTEGGMQLEEEEEWSDVDED